MLLFGLGIFVGARGGSVGIGGYVLVCWCGRGRGLVRVVAELRFGGLLTERCLRGVLLGG